MKKIIIISIILGLSLLLGFYQYKAPAYSAATYTEVNTPGEMKTALESGQNVRFTADIELSSAGYINVVPPQGNEELVIDGNGHKLRITSGNNTSTAIKATRDAMDQRTLRFKNLTIENNNYYGIFRPDRDGEEAIIAIEDITYTGVQPFHFYYGSAITFEGNNDFITNHQEFAETNNLVFISGTTKIKKADTTFNFLRARTTDIKTVGIEVGDGAKVSIETRNTLIDNPYTVDSKIAVFGEGSTLDLNIEDDVFDQPSGNTFVAETGGTINVNAATNIWGDNPRNKADFAARAGGTMRLNNISGHVMPANGNLATMDISDNGTLTGKNITTFVNGNTAKLPIQATGNSKIDLSVDKFFGGYSENAIISAGDSDNDTSKIRISANQAIFGDRAFGNHIQSKGQASIELKSLDVIYNDIRANTEIDVAPQAKLTIDSDKSIFNTIYSNNQIKFDILGKMAINAGAIYNASAAKQFNYTFGDQANVAIQINEPSRRILPFDDSGSTLDIRDQAEVLISNNSMKDLPIIKGAGSNPITIGRSKVILDNTTSAGTQPIIEGVQLALNENVKRSVNFQTNTNPVQTARYPYINFSAIFNGNNKVVTSAMNANFRGDSGSGPKVPFTNALQYLEIGQPTKPELAAESIEFPNGFEGVTDYPPIKGTATPGARVTLHFLDTNRGELVTADDLNNAEVLTKTVDVNGNFAFDIKLKTPLSTETNKQNYTIIVTANYDDPDTIKQPPYVVVKQYDPLQLTLAQVPTILDFGEIPIYERTPDFHEVHATGTLEVTNIDVDASPNWALQISQDEPFKASNSNHQLKNNLYLVDGQQELLLGSDPVTLYQSDPAANVTSVILTDQVTNKLKAKFSRERKQVDAKYNTTVIFTLVQAPQSFEPKIAKEVRDSD
ncbi:pectate lyase-like adhesive domain-containing protein [Agrilactobacillus fermenti]|uniref:pectate lyase-like adhesive domain-containing protein n=1 Tax=Agrilactobacillus fermenti TaxID=2586909 RepID=UPI003A5C45CF